MPAGALVTVLPYRFVPEAILHDAPDWSGSQERHSNAFSRGSGLSAMPLRANVPNEIPEATGIKRLAVLFLPRLYSRFADRESSQADESAASEAAKIICVGFKFGMKVCSNRNNLNFAIVEPAIDANSDAIIFGDDFAHSKASD
jgi:hypothetical protein